MSRINLIALAAVAAPLAACQSVTPPPAVAELAAAGHADAAYAFQALDMNRFEIAAGRLAAERATRAEVLAFAETMIRDHSANLAALTPLAGRLSAAEAGDSLSEPRSQMLEALRARPGHEFDAAYMQSQIAAHEEALQLHERFAAEGQSGPLRGFAARAAALVRGHLQQARSVAVQLGSAPS